MGELDCDMSEVSHPNAAAFEDRVPSDVAAVVQSWKVWAPNHKVRLLNPMSATCYLPDVDLDVAKELKLATECPAINRAPH